LLYQWRYQSQRRGTIQSHFERKIVSIFYHQKYVDVLTCVTRLGLGLQSIASSQHQDGPRQSDSRYQEEVWNNLFSKRLSAKRRKPKFKVNDRVRLNKKFRTFKKSYLPGWTEEVFIVTRVIPGSVVTYKIKEMDDTPLEGTFYSQDLQKVTISDNDLYRVEKVVKEKGNKLLVRWKGWPDKYDSWIDKKDVKKL